MRLANPMAPATNNFNALRIFAVLIVIYGNGFVLTGGVAPGLLGEPFAQVGVDILFAISGFLLPESWRQDPQWRHYWIRRALRLLPGLAGGVLFTVVVIGPLATRLPLRWYLGNHETFRYLENIILLQQRTLPGVFVGQQWSGSVNPMLWTLLGGVLLAVLVPIAAWLQNRHRPILLIVAALALGGLSQWLALLPRNPWFEFMRLDLRLVLTEAPFFLAGLFWYHIGRDRHDLFRADAAICGFLANWFVAAWIGGWTIPLLWITVPYMVACFGCGSAPLLRSLPNISYGMYLTAFPLQQLIVSRAPTAAHPIIACTVLATLFGFLSWFLLERPALQLGKHLLRLAPRTDRLAGEAIPPQADRKRRLTDGRSNNFDFLRIFAAFLVIYGHGCDLAGGIEPGLWGEPLARIGLDIFFSISGFLVTTSWERDPHLPEFLAKRALRIFPGLIACVLLTAFVMGPAVSTLSPSAYFASTATYVYLANIALYAVQQLPGVFTTMSHDGAVNGSLWSLFPEWLCYLTVPLFALLGGRVRRWMLPITALACGAIGVEMFLTPSEQVGFYGAQMHYVLVQVPLFLMGGLYGLLRQRPNLLGRADLCLLFLTLNYGVSAWFGWWSLPISWLTVPYMVVSFGLLSVPGLNRIARFGDFSYGLYLYAFPVQRLVLYLAPGIQAPIAACTLFTLLPAFLSWHLVEKPALRLKPGRLKREPERPSPARVWAGSDVDRSLS